MCVFMSVCAWFCPLHVRVHVSVFMCVFVFVFACVHVFVCHGVFVCVCVFEACDCKRVKITENTAEFKIFKGNNFPTTKTEKLFWYFLNQLIIVIGT